MIAGRLRREVAARGGIPVAEWMAVANAHYYAARDPLGIAGDFTTAPEISQMFGEMVGAWVVDLWQRAGAPSEVRLVELGPGRGTLMADLLRVAGARLGAPYLVEISPALRAEQAALVPTLVHCQGLDEVPVGAPLLLVANEFFDALPVRQFVRTARGWRERVVTLDGDRFATAAGPGQADALVPEALRDAPEGSVFETSPAGSAVAAAIGTRLAADGGAALIIDYGYAGPALGETLQAVRGHAPADPFAAPGEADLTAHVDLAALAAAAGVRAWGPVAQGTFLGKLGIGARARALAAAQPARAREIAAALHRLTAPEAMGTLFKAIALTGPGWPEPAGFAA